MSDFISDGIAALAKHYGDKQFIKAVEELSELTTELAKVNTAYAIGKPEDAAKRRGLIITEMADVEIMLAQLKIIMNSHEEVEAEKHYKVKRQLRRIANEPKQGTPESASPESSL